jgi:putative acetyltransferase
MSEVMIRPAVEGDQKYLVEWLLQPGVLQWFPLADVREIEDAARIWMSYRQQNAVLTAVCDGEPCGSANLYLQPFRKLSHQCLFAIILDEKHRGKGIGTKLLLELMRRAKEELGIELLHLEVYDGNPAIYLYQKLGFIEYGRQPRFVKDKGVYTAAILMQKRL